MAAYIVYGQAMCEVSIIVEADNAEEAMNLANEEFNGIDSYCGNGSYGDKLIGVDGESESISCDGQVEWQGAEIDEE